jgi:hypothetical protein
MFDEVGDPLKFYVGEQVDKIISFRLNKNDEKIGLLTCSQSGGTLSLWEWDSYDTKLPILIHTHKSNPISCIHLISSNLEATRFIVSEKSGLFLFQISKRKIQLVLGPVGHGDVLCFDVTRNGTHLLAAGEDGYLRFYSITDLSLIRTIRASATSLHVARFATDTLIYCASNNKVEVWDLQRSSAEPILYLETREKKEIQAKGLGIQENTSSPVFIWDICVHPDQPFICAAVDSAGNFAIWDLRKNKLAHQLFATSNIQELNAEPIQYALVASEIHNGNIAKASFILSHPNFILTCGEDGTLQLVDLAPLDLDSVFMENLHSSKSVFKQQQLKRFSSILDFTVIGSIVLTANDDESISVKTLTTLDL